VWRSVLLIRVAIQVTAPSMPDATAEAYAEILQREGAKRGFDPITVVAIVENESHWNSHLVGGTDNKCVGLGQHCLQNYAYCRGSYEDSRCQAQKAYLLNGGNNLVATAQAISGWRKYCRRLTGRDPLVHRWLFGYQGHSVNNHAHQCGMRRTTRGWVDVPKPPLVKRVLRRRAEILRAAQRVLASGKRRR